VLDTTPLRSQTFRHLAAAFTVNELGNWIGDVALAILVYSRTQSPLWTATLFLSLRFLPALIAPLLTTRVETFPARRILPALHFAEAAIFAALAVLSHHFVLPLVLALSALDGMLAIAAKALTRSATAAGLLANGLLREGNAILNLGFSMGGAIGPVIAGAVVATSGPGAALWLDAASFAIVAVLLASAPGLKIESDHAAGAVGRLRAGLREVRERPSVSRLMVALAFILMFNAVAIPIEVVFATHTLHAGDRGYGLLLGAWGVGMIVGAGAFAAARKLPISRVLVASAVVMAAGYCGLAVSPTLVVACLFSALGGIGNGAGSVASVTAIQESLPIPSHSAVMAVLESIGQVMPGVGFVIGGLVTAAGSPRTAYALAGAGVAAVLLVIALRSRSIQPLRARSRAESVTPLLTPMDRKAD
jgi:MFS family permease